MIDNNRRHESIEPIREHHLQIDYTIIRDYLSRYSLFYMNNKREF